MKSKIFRLGIRIGLFGIGIGLALLAIHGCGLVPNSPTLAVSVSPKAGHPPFKIAIAAASSVSGGTYTFTPPGGNPVKSTTGQFTATVDTYPYHGTISWTDGNETASQPITVGLINKAPVAHDLSISPFPAYHLQREVIDLTYRESGCRNGTALKSFGIEDPDYTQDGCSDKNDNFQYRIEIHDKSTGKVETVYTHSGQPLPAGTFSSNPHFIWFPDWNFIRAPFPISTMCNTTPTDPTIPSGEARIKIIRVIVREWGQDYVWEYSVKVWGGQNGS